MTTAELINYSLPLLKPTDTVGQALEWMQENRIGQLVIADGKNYWGIVSEDILLDFDETNEVGILPLQFSETYLLDYQHIYEALGLISKYQMQVIPVLNDDKNFIGMLQTSQVYDKFSELLGNHEQGAVIVIRLKNKDYSLAEISRLIESNNAKVLSSYFSGNDFEEENAARLTIKINRTEISSTIATLERFGYVVDAAFAHEPIESLEQERYDMLMRYLSV
jgi:acetoin utilization protein AcuB